MRGLFGRVFGRPPTGEHISAILDIPEVLVTPEIGEAYSVGPSIGVGQTAMVYSATRKRTGEKRALKMFRNETIRTIPQNLDAVRVEIDILRMLPSHPFIVQVRACRHPSPPAWRGTGHAPRRPCPLAVI